MEQESFTNLISRCLKHYAKQGNRQINLLSHNFRIGLIIKLWRNTSYIEFVKQTIGHAKITTTSLYVEHLSKGERKKIIKDISSPEHLITNHEEFY